MQYQQGNQAGNTPDAQAWAQYYQVCINVVHIYHLSQQKISILVWLVTWKLEEIKINTIIFLITHLFSDRCKLCFRRQICKEKRCKHFQNVIYIPNRVTTKLLLQNYGNANANNAANNAVTGSEKKWCSLTNDTPRLWRPTDVSADTFMYDPYVANFACLLQYTAGYHA